jgi:hypothetical protein
MTRNLENPRNRLRQAVWCEILDFRLGAPAREAWPDAI